MNICHPVQPPEYDHLPNRIINYISDDYSTTSASRYQKSRLTNKAGYTANTSRGRVGKAEMRVFALSQLDHHGPTNRPTNGRTDGRTDKASYRVASPRLKTR